MGKAWTRGKERVTFAVIMKVTACNIKRFMRQRVKSLPGFKPDVVTGAENGFLGGSVGQISSYLAKLWQSLLKTMTYPPNLAKSMV